MSVSVSAGIDIALGLLEAAARVSAIVRQRQAEGAEHLTNEDWQSILDQDDAARNRLELAISHAQGSS